MLLHRTCQLRGCGWQGSRQIKRLLMDHKLRRVWNKCHKTSVDAAKQGGNGGLLRTTKVDHRRTLASYTSFMTWASSEVSTTSPRMARFTDVNVVCTCATAVMLFTQKDQQRLPLATGDYLAYLTCKAHKPLNTLAEYADAQTHPPSESRSPGVASPGTGTCSAAAPSRLSVAS